MSDNKDIQFKEFIDKVEKEFGLEVQHYDKYLQLKYLSGIHSILKYFFILSIVTISIAVLVALANIK